MIAFSHSSLEFPGSWYENNFLLCSGHLGYFCYVLDIWGIMLWRSGSYLFLCFTKFSLIPPWQKKGSTTSLLLGGNCLPPSLHGHIKGEVCLVTSQQGCELTFPLASDDAPVWKEKCFLSASHVTSTDTDTQNFRDERNLSAFSYLLAILNSCPAEMIWNKTWNTCAL